jgi:hypothetical protein
LSTSSCRLKSMDDHRKESFSQDLDHLVAWGQCFWDRYLVHGSPPRPGKTRGPR